MIRKLRPLSERKPKEMVRINKLAREVSKRTGYTVKDIIEVWRVGIDIIIENLKQEKSIVLPKIGMLFPAIKPPRKVMSMNGGVGIPTAMEMAARWVVRFKPGKFIKKELTNHPVSKEQVEDLYED
tara:strand:+ start:2436 stop:2813 length:378 start_codon:yes stop_codon:yes gene_type:complete